MSWNDVRNKINKHTEGTKSWRSEHNSLLHICDKAETWGLTSEYAERAGISNLRTAIPEMKRNIRWKNKEGLLGNMMSASDMSNVLLRLALHTNELDEIHVSFNDGMYTLTLNELQYNKLMVRTRLVFELLVEEKPAPLPKEFLKAAKEIDMILAKLIG